MYYTHCRISALGQLHDLTSGMVGSFFILTIGVGLLFAAVTSRTRPPAETVELASCQRFNLYAWCRTALRLVPASLALGTLLLLASHNVARRRPLATSVTSRRYVTP